MNTLSDQEIFNKVVQHLRTQGRPALQGGSCAYLGQDGSSCAVGCLIPSSHYQGCIENLSVRTLGLPLDPAVEPNKLIRAGILRKAITAGIGRDPGGENSPTLKLLMDLQGVHDNVTFWEDTGYDRTELEYRLRGVADRYYLEMPT